MPIAQQPFPFIFFVLAIFTSSCASNEIGQSKDVNQAAIYQQYLISFDETEDHAELVAQFRFAGSDGTTLELNEPSNFQLDGKRLTVDSSDFLGAFYKGAIPARTALGNHQLVFTDYDKKRWKNDFSIESFRLMDVPASIDRAAPVLIRFEAPPLKAGDLIELNSSNTDSGFTLYYSPSDSGNVIQIPAEQLRRQQGKEFSINGVLNRSVPLSQFSKEGGIISITQSTRPHTIKIGNPSL